MELAIGRGCYPLATYVQKRPHPMHVTDAGA